MVVHLIRDQAAERLWGFESSLLRQDMTCQHIVKSHLSSGPH